MRISRPAQAIADLKGTAFGDAIFKGPLAQHMKKTGMLGAMRARLEDEIRGIREARVELEYLAVIRASLPRESIQVIDNTQLGYWAEYFYPAYSSGSLMGTKGSTTIGFSLATLCRLFSTL